MTAIRCEAQAVYHTLGSFLRDILSFSIWILTRKALIAEALVEADRGPHGTAETFVRNFPGFSEILSELRCAGQRREMTRRETDVKNVSTPVHFLLDH